MPTGWLLVGVLALPLLGFALIFCIPRKRVRWIHAVSLGSSVLTLLLLIGLWTAFNPEQPGFQFVLNLPWITSLDVGLRLGIDGVSLLLALLTAFLMPIALLASLEPIRHRQKEYYAMMLLLETAMLGVFMALDTFLFYVFWELVLIPMYFIIGIWGGKNRVYAALKFFLYTLVGSLLMLVAIVWLGVYAEQHVGGFTADFERLRQIAPGIPHETQRWLFWAFALSFCIKVPLFPLHTWLPDAHVEAPTAGSVILAGVLLKMGTYGLIRFNLELFPQASFEYATLLAWLGVVGILYGALVAFAQSDMKKLIAYSSVSHLGFIVLGIFSMTVEGLQGALIQMVNHGLSTGMLFLCVGLLYERRHTRELAEFGGLARIMPLFALLLAFAVLSSVGLPGLNGFIGEFLSLLGAARSRFLDNFLLVILGACGVILAAVYLLKFYHATMFGQPGNPENYHLRDLNWLERVQLVPLVLLFIGIGVYPRPFLQTSEVALRGLVAKLEQLRFGTTSIPTPSPLQPVPREQQPQPTPGAPDPQKLLEEHLRRMPPPRP
ncbi:MAG: NADH-quinone oxidoreductase subunit M [Candidatus Kapabacteria bacterium]|nr:NADH-quinone oxidoreductase subunit M [Candidatus Kapabacteria bacterium]MDW8225090.1 NADH-quinone oxidoreductase subunit M [Bacteroidota bacterium]